MKSRERICSTKKKALMQRLELIHEILDLSYICRSDATTKYQSNPDANFQTIVTQKVDGKPIFFIASMEPEENEVSIGEVKTMWSWRPFLSKSTKTSFS